VLVVRVGAGVRALPPTIRRFPDTPIPNDVPQALFGAGPAAAEQELYDGFHVEPGRAQILVDVERVYFVKAVGIADRHLPGFVRVVIRAALRVCGVADPTVASPVAAGCNRVEFIPELPQAGHE
jgi:hypothetical protein